MANHFEICNIDIDDVISRRHGEYISSCFFYQTVGLMKMKNVIY